MFEAGARGGLSGPVVADQVADFGSRDHHLYALDALDGTSRWKFETAYEVESTVVLHDDLVIVASMDSHIYARKRLDGSGPAACECTSPFSVDRGPSKPCL